MYPIIDIKDASTPNPAPVNKILLDDIMTEKIGFPYVSRAAVMCIISVIIKKFHTPCIKALFIIEFPL